MESTLQSGYQIRLLDPAATFEVELVARRMRETLVEVLGEPVGVDLYSLDWLKERVLFHLDATKCIGQVFLSEAYDAQIIGHAIARIDRDDVGNEIGLFSTIFVEPRHRSQGVAKGLVGRVEEWFKEQKMKTIWYNTAASNKRLIGLLYKFDYQIVAAMSDMVRLAKSLA